LPTLFAYPAHSGRNLVFDEAFCRANDLPLLETPFQKDSDEIGQCPFFSGRELFRLGPRCFASVMALEATFRTQVQKRAKLIGY
jgi:hypothetical protein